MLTRISTLIPPRLKARKTLLLVPITLTIGLLLMFSYTEQSIDPIFTHERQATLQDQDQDHATGHHPLLLNPLPPQIHEELTWPPNIHKPLCLPKIFVYPDSVKMGEFQVTEVPQMGTNYVAEQILLKQLRDKDSAVYKNYVTENPEEADLFYIPFLGSKYLAHCWFTLGKTNSDCDVDDLYVEPMMNHIQRDYPYWNRSMGADHVMTHPMDRSALYYTKRDRMMNATFLTTIGDKRTQSSREGRFRRYKDITIPSATALLDLAFVNPAHHLDKAGHPLKGERDIFLLFGGNYKSVTPDDNYSTGVRSLLNAGLDMEPGYKVAPGWSHEEYTQLLTRAKYGLAPQGYTLDTTRIWEYIAFGVVPVVIADGIVEPFEDDLDWSSFVVKIPRRDAHRIDVILRGMSEEDYEDKRKMLWDHGRQVLLDHDAWNLIVRSLCRMRGLEGKKTVSGGEHVYLEAGDVLHVNM